MAQPNANSPNTSTRQPSSPSNIHLLTPSTGATSRHGLTFPQALSPNIFHDPHLRWKAAFIKSKRISVPLTLIRLSSTTSPQAISYPWENFLWQLHCHIYQVWRKHLKHNQVIITGLRDRTNGLWNIPLEPRPPAQQSSTRSHPSQANAILSYDTTKPQHAK